MNITAAVSPDLGSQFWQPLVLPTRTVPARYTTRPEWSSDNESMWMRLSKFSLLNRLSLHALAGLVAARSDEARSGGVDLRCADRFVLFQLASLLKIPQALDGFCLPTSHPALAWAATELRYCPACLELGFHAAWFQWRFIEWCPVHGLRLRCGCHKCAALIPYALDISMATYPLLCAQCRTPWVPMLNRPAGRCVPITGRAGRILSRWQVHVADAMKSVSTIPSQARDPLTGRFIPRQASDVEIRMACRVQHIQLLNGLYDVPPPSTVELLERHRFEPGIAEESGMITLPGEDWQADATPYVCDDWPHFGNDFLEYEQVLKHVGRALFGSTHRVASVRLSGKNHGNAFFIDSRYMDADQAASLGWSISWYGVSRTCAPHAEPSTPAVGLAGWLAHAPHRPFEVPSERWRDQLFAWLAEDLAKSAWAWSRIAQFMRARGKYLLHAQLVRPPELAERHRYFQDGTQAFGAWHPKREAG